MSRLSATQQSFLDNYIRKHRLLGKKKSSDALKFAQRKAEVEALIRQLPTFLPIVKELQAQLEQADQLADNGEFKSAYKRLDKTKSAAQKATTNYDPAPDMQQIVRQITAFVKNGQEAAPQMNALHQWRQARQDTPPPAVDKAEKFVKTANLLVETFVARITEIGRAAKTPPQSRTVDNLRNDLWGKVTADDLAPLRRKRDTFFTSEDLKTLCTVQGWGALELTDNAQRDRELLQQTKDKMRPMRQALKTVKPPEFSKDFQAQIDPKATSRDDLTEPTIYRRLPGFAAAKDQAKLAFAGELDEQLKNDAEEKVLGLLSKSLDEIEEDVCRAKNWPTDRDSLSDQQLLELRAISVGMREAVAEKNPNRLDLSQGIVTIGGETYHNPKELARGANGKVERFESQTNPGQFIVLKTNFPHNLDETEYKTGREALEGHYALQGDDRHPGKQNIGKLKGLISDENGESHIAIDYAPGGDVDQSRSAMTAATECGVLPEECRAVLNQFLMKQAVEGVAYLHEQNMLHNDLKPGNMMLDNDGNLQIVDFGETVPGEDTTGKVHGDKLVGTPGYDDLRAADQGKLSLKGDDYSLGMMAGVMERGRGSARANFKTMDTTAFTGALGNFAKGLSDPDPEKRPTLEAVLNSSYLGNLKNYDEQDVKQLMQSVIEYGKAIDVEKVQTTHDKILFLREQMDQMQGQIRDPQTDAQKRKLLLQQFQQSVIDIEFLQEQIRDLGSDPQAEEALRKIREISTRLQGRDASPKTDVPEFKRFVELLGTTEDQPHQFRAIAGLRSYDAFYQERNIDPAKIRNLISFYDYDLTDETDNAKNVVAEAETAYHDFLSTLNDVYFQKILTTALTNLFGEILKQYNASHPGDTYQPQHLK